jgi:hypothetical protein
LLLSAGGNISAITVFPGSTLADIDVMADSSAVTAGTVLLNQFVKINSSRGGVTRDRKLQFVNSSRELEMRDIPQNFVKP